MVSNARIVSAVIAALFCSIFKEAAVCATGTTLAAHVLDHIQAPRRGLLAPAHTSSTSPTIRMFRPIRDNMRCARARSPICASPFGTSPSASTARRAMALQTGTTGQLLLGGGHQQWCYPHHVRPARCAPTATGRTARRVRGEIVRRFSPLWRTPSRPCFIPMCTLMQRRCVQGGNRHSRRLTLRKQTCES